MIYPKSTDGTVEFVQWFNMPFPARVSAVTAGSGNFSGVSLYDWTEQQFNPDTGAYTDVDGGRSGTAASQPAVEVNNQSATLNKVYWMRFKGIVNGDGCYEFIGKLGGGVTPGAFSGVKIADTLSLNTFPSGTSGTDFDWAGNTPEWDTDNYYDSGSSTILFTIPADGYYLINARVRMPAPGADAMPRLAIYGGASAGTLKMESSGYTLPALSGGVTPPLVLEVCGVIHQVTNDAIKLEVFNQNSGVTLTTASGSDLSITLMSLT